MKYFSIGGLIIFWIGCLQFMAFAARRIASLKNRSGLSFIRLIAKTNKNRVEVWGELLIPLCFLLVVGSFVSYRIFPILIQPADPSKVDDKKEPPSEAAVPTPKSRTQGVINVHGPYIIKDQEGRRALFDVFVFLQEFNWKKGENLIESDEGTKSGKEMIAYLSSIHGNIRTCAAVACVGSASFAGIDHQEEQRAWSRAKVLMSWLRPAFGPVEKNPPELFYVSLGHYPNPPDKYWQRPVIIFGISPLDGAVNIHQIMSSENSEALRQELAKKLPPEIHGGIHLFDYTRFDIKPAY